jgi:hypothetical protein
MGINKNKNHLVVSFEDRANLQLWNGFISSIKGNQIKSLGISGGRDKALKNIKNAEILKYSMRYFLLIWDYDNNYGERYQDFQKTIEALNLTNRCFVLGSKKDPEELRRKLGLTLEEIGEKLAKECLTKNYDLWNHELLKHNKLELDRLNQCVCKFLIEE